MKYDIKTASVFETQLQKIIKKYPKIKEDIFKYVEEIESNGVKGTPIPSKSIPGKKSPKKQGFYKDRLPLKPYNISESDGLRIICYSNPNNSTVIILAMIYLKCEIPNPTNQMFKDFLKTITIP